MFYKLEDTIPVKINDKDCFKQEKINKILQQTQVGKYFISTVFVSIDIGIFEPLVFETMVFDDAKDVHCVRRFNWAEALNDHLTLCIEYALKP